MTGIPALFVSHGAPTLPLEDSPARRFLEQLGHDLPRPRAILAVSAHWETAQPAVSRAEQPDTIHDFHGFPEALYRLRYPAPGAPQLADRAAGALRDAGFEVAVDPQRGLDHGAWTPLILMYPAADIPVTQLSIQPREGPEHHWRLGEALRPLRDDGVLILASGSATHNLREFRGSGFDAEPAPWARTFGEWLSETIEHGRHDELLQYRSGAPEAVRNHPTDEHLLPLFVAAGAATPGSPAARIHSSYAYRVIGMDAYRFD
jgi:4,5-DOPA dioxygenase extradiol